jgi:ATP-dependent RNA helicase DDX19/DBP5
MSLRGTQMVLLSATFTDKVRELVEHFVPKPFNEIRLPETEVSLEHVRQAYVELDGDQAKFNFLDLLYNTVSVGQTIIFCERRSSAQAIATRMSCWDLFLFFCMY